MIEDMAQVRMTEAELARDLHVVLKRVQNGAEVVIEQDHRLVAVIKTSQGPGRTLSECIAIAKRREHERGYPVTFDPDFAADVEEIVRNRQTWNQRKSRWNDELDG